MRNKVFLLLFLFIPVIVNCQHHVDLSKIKDEDFKKYVSCFQIGNLPFSTYDDIKITYHDFDLSQIRRFICEDDSCFKDWSGYDISFASYLLLPSNGAYVILIHDESTEGGTIRMLSTYDYNGLKISELEIFAEKPFHGERQKNEIDYYEIESIISNDLRIEKKYFAIYAEEWKVDDTRYFYGRYIEFIYKIETNGNITLISEKDYGKQKYVGGRLDFSFFPRWKLAQ